MTSLLRRKLLTIRPSIRQATERKQLAQGDRSTTLAAGGRFARWPLAGLLPIFMLAGFMLAGVVQAADTAQTKPNTNTDGWRSSTMRIDAARQASAESKAAPQPRTASTATVGRIGARRSIHWRSHRSTQVAPLPARPVNPIRTASHEVRLAQGTSQPDDPFDDLFGSESAADSGTSDEATDAEPIVPTEELPTEELPMDDAPVEDMPLATPDSAADSAPTETITEPDTIAPEPRQPAPLGDNDSPFADEPDSEALSLGPGTNDAFPSRAEENCAVELRELRAETIDKIDLSISVAGVPGEDYPFECSLGDEPFAPRQWAETIYTWKASGLCHKPLYFEDVQLERYGHSHGPYTQPLISGAHFFATLPILPYKMGLKTPDECVYALGHYRPGSCAPYFVGGYPFTWRAALFEAGAVAGAAAIIP